MLAKAKPPRAEAIEASLCDGFLPAQMMFAGCAGVVVLGRSPKPVYL